MVLQVKDDGGKFFGGAGDEGVGKVAGAENPVVEVDEEGFHGLEVFGILLGVVHHDEVAMGEERAEGVGAILAAGGMVDEGGTESL